MDMEQKVDEPVKQTTAKNIPVDSEKQRLERMLVDAFAVQSIKLGDQLGLYVAMHEAQVRSDDGYITLETLCDMARTDLRMTLEWIRFQVKLGFVAQRDDKDRDKFRLSISAAQYLLPPSYSPVSMTGSIRLATCMMDLTPVLASFETGKQSLFCHDEPQDVKFVENLADSKTVENRIRYARESFCTKFFRDKFVSEVLLKLEDGNEIVGRLDCGAIDCVETLCGATSGTLAITLASRFRNARFIGFETSHVSLSRARDLSRAAATKNARFYDVKERSVSFGPPPSQSKMRQVKPGFGLAVTFLSLSMMDVASQLAMFKDVREGLEPDACWIIMDLDSEQNDIAFALCAGMSLLHFLPSMAAPSTSTPFTFAKCQELAAVTGFTQVQMLTPVVVDEMLVRINAFALRI